MAVVEVVRVTFAHPLEVADAVSIGLSPTGLPVGTVVDVPVGVVRRLWVSGLIEQDGTTLDDLIGTARPPGVDPDYVTFTGPDAPVVEPGVKYIWLQTGTGSDGTGTTIWVEDGTS